MEYLNKTKYSCYKRFCKTLELKNSSELIAEYKRIHAGSNACPEVTQGMKEVGIIDMEIYLIDTRLFMIMDTVPDFDHPKAMEELVKKPRQTEWEIFVSRFQITAEDAATPEKWKIMERIYKMSD